MDNDKIEISAIEKSTSKNVQNLLLEKILTDMGFTKKEIALNFIAKSKTPCSFN